jgi:microsomal epoxide hydrolase
MSHAEEPVSALRRISFRTSDGVTLSAIESSPPAPARGAPTLLLLPGWCMPATVWRRQLRALGERWRTVALDPRGQGDSEVPAAGYEVDRRADDIAEVRHHLGPCVVVAWSLAALEALQCVHRHGSAGIHGLVLVDSSVGEPPVPPPVTGFVDRLRADRARAVHDFVRAVFGAALPEADLREIERTALRMPLEGSARLLSDSHPREHWRHIARAFDRPLFYIVTPQFREQAVNLQAERPATRIEIFDNAGHALFLDEPERFNRLLSTWIDHA